MDVSVVIVHFRAEEETRRCLASLDSACRGLAFETFVVDNSPSQRLTLSAGGATVIPMGGNTGLARATNEALRRGTGRYYLCLNPDVVALPGSVKALVDFADGYPAAGIVAARLQNADGTLQLSCRRFYTLGHVLARRTPLRLVPAMRSFDREHLMEDYDHRVAANVDWVLGSCMLVRAQAVAGVGPMDPRFFLYFEDVDWCYRMHRGGWDVVYYPHASMVHHHRRDSARAGLTPEKRAHVASFVIFHRIHGWKLLVRPPATFRPLPDAG